MTHPREPHTVPHAVTIIAGRIDYPEMALLVGKSESLVRKWSDPRAGRAPTLAQAMALDAAYLAVGGDRAPILSAYSHIVDVRVAAETACLTQLRADVATASREFGEAMAFTIEAAEQGASDHTILLAQREVEQARTVMAVIGRRLSSFLTLRRGAGSGKPGGAHD